MSPGPPSRASPPTLSRTRPSRITKGLVVGMMMQPGSLAGLVVHQEERHRARAMPTALEGARNLVARPVTGVHVIHRSTPPQRLARASMRLRTVTAAAGDDQCDRHAKRRSTRPAPRG